MIERLFEAGDETIRLVVEAPQPDGQDFRCAVTLQGAGFDRRDHAMGIDQVQALVLALAKAHIDLLQARRDGLAVTWLGGRDLGLPLPPHLTVADIETAD